MGIRYFIAVGALLAAVFLIKEKRWFMVVLLVVLVLMGNTGTNRLYQRFLNDDLGFRMNEKGMQITVTSAPGTPGKIKNKNRISLEGSTTKYDILKSLTATEAVHNVIQNGDFGIPFGLPISAWGHGLYTDLVNKDYRNKRLTWVNFLDADINVSVDENELGSALKIENRAGNTPHKVGIMEQTVRVTPGKYAFSFWVKAEADVKEKSLQFSTTRDWYVVEPSTQKKRGFELEKAGPFEWQQFSGEIEVDVNGLLTFVVISKNTGTLYLADLRLIRKS